MEQIKHSIKNSAKTVLLCLGASLLIFVQLSIIDSDYLYMNPFISGYLHSGLSHFALNILIIFVALLHPINKDYGWNKIYWITFIIAMIYLPISILKITSVAIGLSGTGYFLMTRAAFSWNRISKGIILFLAFCEAFCIANNDGVAHGVHLIGIILGFISLKQNQIQYLTKKPSFRRVF